LTPRATIRAEWNIPNDATLFASIGRFMPDKNIPALLRAVRSIITHRQDCRWVLVGKGPLEQRLRQQCTALGLDEFVKFAGFRKDIPEILSAIDSLVVPSTSEGCCVAILEAMACGKPVIATDVGGTREVVLDGETGYVIAPNDIAALSDRMQRIADDGELKRKMAHASLAKAQADFSVVQMVRRIEAVYDNLIKQRR
jgi:glycosyltransferase involved in cell wall biosynthesis